MDPYDENLQTNQKVKNEGEDIVNKPFELFQYFRYNSVHAHTKVNNNAMYYGEIGLVTNSSNNVFEEFSKNGYVTGFFEDGCDGW